MSGRYILHGHEPVLCDDLIEWGRWFQTDDRIVKRDDIDGIKISTVFLGLDHSFFHGASPLLFETMIFGGRHDNFQKRYGTWDRALKGHADAVALVKKEGKYE